MPLQADTGETIVEADVPDQPAEIDNRRLPIRRTCDVSMAVLLCRDHEVELAISRA